MTKEPVDDFKKKKNFQGEKNVVYAVMLRMGRELDAEESYS